MNRVLCCHGQVMWWERCGNIDWIVTHASDPWKSIDAKKSRVTSSLIIEDLLFLVQGHGM